MNFSEIETDSLPPVAAHLYTLAQTFSSRNHHRSAALAYASASRASGTTVHHHAVSLYLAAQQLFLSVQATTDEDIQAEDRARAVGYLQKCKLLARELPSPAAFICTMQSLALIERISTYVNDHLGAAKTINQALNLISTGSDDPKAQLVWWSYFRSKAISNALACGNSVQQAILVAAESASVCDRNKDLLSAAAFHLCQSQIALGASEAGINNVKPNIDLAIKCLDGISNVPKHREMDYLLLNFAAQVLQSLTFVRVGDLGALRDHLSHLSKAYNRYRQGLKQQQQHPEIYKVSWHWWPQQYLTAITYYIMTAVSRSNCEMSNALVHAMTALSRIGISEDRLTSFTLENITTSGVSPRATLSLAVALLENATRIRLTQVKLNEASALIGAIVDLTFRDETARSYIRQVESHSLPSEVSLSTVISSNYEDVGITPRCTAFLLLGEYHNLRGRVSAARTATTFLDAVRSFTDSSPEPPPSDTMQMVVSYLSLLTGDDRATLANSIPTINHQSSPDDESSAFSRNFISAQVHALAWFTNGVFQMRKTDVIESRRALSNCLSIVNQSPYGNEQIIANASAVLSGLVIARENTGSEGFDMASTAVTLSNNLGDVVAIVRATRQFKKVVNRLSQSPTKRQEAEDDALKAYNYFSEQSRQGGTIFSHEPEK